MVDVTQLAVDVQVAQDAAAVQGAAQVHRRQVLKDVEAVLVRVPDSVLVARLVLHHALAVVMGPAVVHAEHLHASHLVIMHALGVLDAVHAVEPAQDAIHVLVAVLLLVAVVVHHAHHVHLAVGAMDAKDAVETVSQLAHHHAGHRLNKKGDNYGKSKDVPRR